MNYLHLYSSITEHDADYYGENYHEPWTAYIQENNSVTYNLEDYRNTVNKELYTEFKRVNRNQLTEEEEELFKNYIVEDLGCFCADCELVQDFLYLKANEKYCYIGSNQMATEDNPYSCLRILKESADASKTFTWSNSKPSGCAPERETEGPILPG